MWLCVIFQNSLFFIRRKHDIVFEVFTQYFLESAKDDHELGHGFDGVAIDYETETPLLLLVTVTVYVALPMIHFPL